MSNIHILNVVTRLDCPAERVIAAASEAGLEDVVIAGFDVDGEFYFASNKASGPEVLWLLQMASKKLIEIGDG